MTKMMRIVITDMNNNPIPAARIAFVADVYETGKHGLCKPYNKAYLSPFLEIENGVHIQNPIVCDVNGCSHLLINPSNKSEV